MASTKKTRRHDVRELVQDEVAYAAPQVYLLQYFADRVPPFTLYTAELMELDETVWFASCVADGPLYAAEILVKARSPEVREFVHATWKKFWSGWSWYVMRSKQFGYQAFQVLYRYDHDKQRWELDRLKDLHPRDVRVLTVKRKKVGVRIKAGASYLPQVNTQGQHDLWGAGGLWCVHQFEFGGWYGRALFEKAHNAWWEKRGRGGGIDVRRLRMMKDAWRGDFMRYPEGTRKDEEGKTITNRAFALKMIEMLQSGGVVALPTARDQKTGEYLWDYTPPSGGTAGASQVIEWVDKLDDGVLRAMNVPKEVIEAATSGSGFSGRSIPMISFLTMGDRRLKEHVRDWRRDIMDPLVDVNYAGETYDVELVPLVEIVGEQVGNMGQPNLSSQANPARPPGPPAGQLFPGAGRPASMPPQNGRTSADRIGIPRQFAGDDAEQPAADQLVEAAASAARAISDEVSRRVQAALKKNGTRSSFWPRSPAASRT